MAIGGLAAAHADPVTVKSGATPLSGAGLTIDLPPRSGDYHVSMSWALDDKGSFDSRDIVDEFNTKGDIVAGNWVLTGFFDAGECDQVLAADTLDKSWKAEVDLWGQHWKVRGGVYTFESASLGRKPAAILCTTTDDSGRALLLYRYLTDQPETLDQASVLADVKSSVVLERAWNAYRDRRLADVVPLKRPEVKMRGTIAAARTVTLTKSKLRVDLPDDGYVWLANATDVSDILDRMAPSMPDVSIEVLTVDKMSCADALGQITSDKKSDFTPRSVPNDWTAGPTLVVDGDNEMILCHATSYGAVLAGILGATKQDVTPYHPILAALERAPKTP